MLRIAPTITHERPNKGSHDLRGHVHEPLGPLEPSLSFEHKAQSDSRVHMAARKGASNHNGQKQTQRDEDAREDADEVGRHQLCIEAHQHTVGEHRRPDELEENYVEEADVVQQEPLQSLR